MFAIEIWDYLKIFKKFARENKHYLSSVLHLIFFTKTRKILCYSVTVRSCLKEPLSGQIATF